MTVRRDIPALALLVPKSNLFRRRSIRLRARIFDLLDEKDGLESRLDRARDRGDDEGAKEIADRLARMEAGEDRLYRELERLTLLAERTDSAFWRWLMFVFAFINVIMTVLNFSIHVSQRKP